MNNIYDDKAFFDCLFPDGPEHRRTGSCRGMASAPAAVPCHGGQPGYWIWAAAMAGTANTPWNRAPAEALGLDLSEKMIAEARARNADPRIRYEVCGIAEYSYPAGYYDLVVSNLALHYLADLDDIYRKVFSTLRPGGVFLFNIEHPVFTAGVREDWVRDAEGRPVCWPVDNYYYPGERTTLFLGQEVKKQHHTLTQILMGLIRCGFVLEAVEEAMPIRPCWICPV